MVGERKIVDDVSGWMTVFDDGSVDRSWTGPAEVKFMADPVAPHEHFMEGVATRDVTIDNESGLRVRIYLPECDDENEKLPILLHFHGGGFCISEANWYMYYDTYTRLARAARVMVVSVYLRRAPEHRLPAAIDDAYSALIWLRSLARGNSKEPWVQSRSDFTRVFLVGDSSGGNLVYQVAVQAADEDLSPMRLAGAILIHPGFARSRRSRSEMEKPESPFLTLDMLDKFIGYALPVGSTKDHPITCPMGKAAPPVAGLKLPPMLYCVADDDLAIDTQMEFYYEMCKANKDVELLINHGMGHSFYLNKIALALDPSTAAQDQKLIQGITHFIKKL